MSVSFEGKIFRRWKKRSRYYMSLIPVRNKIVIAIREGDETIAAIITAPSSLRRIGVLTQSPAVSYEPLKARLYVQY